jgi:hypothetical protein
VFHHSRTARFPFFLFNYNYRYTVSQDKRSTRPSSLSLRQLKIQPLIIHGDRISCMGLRYPTSSLPRLKSRGKEWDRREERKRFLNEGLKHSSVSLIIEYGSEVLAGFLYVKSFMVSVWTTALNANMNCWFY